MEYYAGLDVSLWSCAICVVDGKGTVLHERGLPCGIEEIADCLAEGTSIQTNSGAAPVQDIRSGDFVQTKDNGLKEVLWVGKRHIHRAELLRFHQLRPVLIRPGFFGDHGPLLLSQQHRVLVASDQLGLSLSCREAFIKAKHLAEYVPKAARVANGKTHVSYCHILLESHEVLFSGGIDSESMLRGAMALKGMPRRVHQPFQSRSALCFSSCHF